MACFSGEKGYAVFEKESSFFIKIYAIMRKPGEWPWQIDEHQGKIPFTSIEGIKHRILGFVYACLDKIEDNKK